jgi:hypothetical protein
MGREVVEIQERNKPCSGVAADPVYLYLSFHSAAVAAPELCADAVEFHDILAKPEVVGQVLGASKAAQEVDDVLLLAGELLCKLVAALLELLLGSELDNLLALLRNILSGSFALARDRLALSLALHSGRGGFGSRALELVNALHVIEEVVTTGETMSRDGTLAVLEVAQVRPCAVSVHAVRLALVAEQACSGGELDADAGLLVATERLQVRVDVLVVVALQRCRLVGASRLALLRAMVLAILVRTLLVKHVASSNFGTLLFELSLSSVGGGLNVFVAVQRLWCQ